MNFVADLLEKIKKGLPNGVASLDSNGKVPNEQINFDLYVVTSDLESVSNPDKNKIYLVPNGNDIDNIFDEYIHVNNKWEFVGSANVDLSDYYIKSEVDTKLSTKINTSEKGANNGVAELGSDGKVKPTQLPSNTTPVQSNWDENNTSSLAYIQNKPTIPEGADLTNYYNKSETDSKVGSKVDKVIGKELSSNDFTTQYKNKVDSAIQSGTINGVNIPINEDKLEIPQINYNDLKNLPIIQINNILNDFNMLSEEALYYAQVGSATNNAPPNSNGFSNVVIHCTNKYPNLVQNCIIENSIFTRTANGKNWSGVNWVEIASPSLSSSMPKIKGGVVVKAVSNGVANNIVVTHGGGATPSAISAIPTTAANQIFVNNQNTTTFQINFTPLATANIYFYWMAIF